MPAVALLGSRQVGKTTLALEISKNYLDKSVSYMDLELYSDLAKLDDAESYLRTSQQTEIDLILEKSNKETWAIEIKRSAAPKIKPGFHRACNEIKATRKFVVYSGKERPPMTESTEAMV